MTDNNIDFFTNLDWTDTTEDLLISWTDISHCYTWIFDRSYRKYNSINYRFTIPIIVLSTITGTISMSMESILPAESVRTGQVIIGGINIFTGILGTLHNFFRYAQESELHLTATNDWSRFHRNIKIELSIERGSRKPAVEFIRSTRQEYERLLNNRPVIPSNVIDEFKKTFRHSDIIKPEILDKICHTYIDDEKNVISQYTVNKKRLEQNPKISLVDKLLLTIKSPKNNSNTNSNTNSNINSNINSNTNTPSLSFNLKPIKIIDGKAVIKEEIKDIRRENKDNIEQEKTIEDDLISDKDEMYSDIKLNIHD